MFPWQNLNQPTRTTEEEEALVWVQVLGATNLVVEDPEVEVVVEVDMAKVDMITVVDMTHMVQVMMMEVIMIVIMMVAAMVEEVMVVDMAIVGMAMVGMAIVGMAMRDMVEEEVTLVVVGEEVVQEARTPVEVKVGQAEVGQVVVVAAAVAALVVEVGVHVVVHLEEGVGKVEEGALVHRSASMVVTAIKVVVAVGTLNQRGSMLITVISTASRSHSSSGAKTTATVTRVISSGTRTVGRSSSGSDYADWQPLNLSNQICDELIQFCCLEPNHFFIFDWIGKLGQTLRKCT